MATPGKSQVARDEQPKPSETKGAEALVGTAGVGVTELETPFNDTSGDGKADKAKKEAQATVDKYTNNKTAQANKELGRVGEDKA